MKRRSNGEDCFQCCLKGCDCECKTCVDARERNNSLSQKELDKISLENAINDFCPSEESKQRTRKILEEKGLL